MTNLPLELGIPAGQNPGEGGTEEDDLGVALLDAIAGFEEWQHRRNLSHRTIETRRFVVARFRQHIGHHLLSATPADVETWLDSLPIAPQTRHAYTRQLSAFFAYCVREGFVDVNPCDKVVKPRLPQGIPRPMDAEDFARAVRLAEPRMAAMLALAGYAGLRCLEISNLRVEDIDWRRRLLIVAHGKGDKGRLIPLHDELRARLRAVAPKHGYVFYRTWPRVDTLPLKPNTISRYIGSYLRSLGIDASAHMGRHMFLSAVYESTRDLRVTQALAGHANPRETARYAAWSEARAQEAVRNLSFG